ncbi:MAG: metal-sulfur cluster assembly factor [Candidatus Eremiobacteraeota bacterium]|nr:metal-sulfur cluster assembly factor [Candidatus Eremiobacteraeota bacterium]
MAIEPSAPPPADAAAVQPALTEELVREELKTVIDPEIGLDVVNLGLIYEVRLDGDRAHVLMTLTSPGCPVAGAFMASVKTAVEAIPGVSECTVDLTFSPPWDPRTMASDEAKLMMGFYY